MSILRNIEEKSNLETMIERTGTGEIRGLDLR
jgi:hypothetical protein